MAFHFKKSGSNRFALFGSAPIPKWVGTMEAASSFETREAAEALLPAWGKAATDKLRQKTEGLSSELTKALPPKARALIAHAFPKALGAKRSAALFHSLYAFIHECSDDGSRLRRYQPAPTGPALALALAEMDPPRSKSAEATVEALRAPLKELAVQNLDALNALAHLAVEVYQHLGQLDRLKANRDAWLGFEIVQSLDARESMGRSAFMVIFEDGRYAKTQGASYIVPTANQGEAKLWPTLAEAQGAIRGHKQGFIAELEIKIKGAHPLAKKGLLSAKGAQWLAGLEQAQLGSALAPEPTPGDPEAPPAPKARRRAL